jgi:arsenical pump membrane protein
LTTVGLVLSLQYIGTGRRLGTASAAALGVVVLLTTRVVSPADLASGFEVLWAPFLAITSIMLSTNAAQRLGILDYAARLIEPRPGQPVVRVFRSVFIFSAVIAAVLNNDAAILLLTPLIVGVVRRCYPRRPDLMMPFAFAVFSAAGVAPLVVSNPMNLIVSEYAGIGFNEYAARMVPIAVSGWITSYLVLRIIFRRQLHAVPGCETGSASKPPVPVLSRPGKIYLATMVAALGCYPALSYADGPVWAVAVGSATFGVWLCRHYGIASAGRLAAPVPWEILIFLYCIFIIVLGLRNVGLVDRITEFYSFVDDSKAQVLVIGIASALGSALLNNHPMAILNSLAILNLPHGTHEQLMAALIGGDLGPRLLPIGSLAGLLWLNSLQTLGVYIRPSRFILVGLPVTIPALGVSLIVLLLGMTAA